MKPKRHTHSRRASLITTALNVRYLASVVAGTTAAAITSSHAADIRWTGTTGSFHTPGNWETNTIPGPNDYAWVGNGGTAVFNPGDPQLTVQDLRAGAGGIAGSYEQNGSIVNNTSWFRLAVDADSIASYTMNGGILNIRSNRLDVGEKGQGTLNITGGLIYHANGVMIVGDRNGGTDSGVASKGVVNQSGGTFTNESEVWIGLGADGDGTDSGTMNLTGGTFNVRRWMVVGRTGGEGTLNVSGTNTILAKSREDGAFVLGDVAGANNPRGTVNQDGGTVMIGSECWLGQTPTGHGIYNLNGGDLRLDNILAIGRAGGTGVFNHAGGTFTLTGGGNYVVGREGSPSGVVNHTAGLANIVEAELRIGESVAEIQGVGTYNLSDTGVLRVANVNLSQNLTAQGTLNLSGGTAYVSRIFKTATTEGSSGVVNFNGTQVVATSNQPSFINNLSTANIAAGGFKLDTDAYELGTSQVFSGSGGLTKTGLGTLTISANYNATGPVAVSRGKLGLNLSTFNASELSLSDGATLTGDGGTVTGTTTVAASGAVLLYGGANATPLNFTGNVILNGPTRIDINEAFDSPIAPGTYTVATYSGAVTGEANLFLGRPGSVSFATPGEIQITVQAPRTLTWTGATNSTWDIFSTSNWDNSGSGAAFGQGDSVTLGDTAGTINVLGPIRPKALTLDNSLGNTIILQAGNASSEITGSTVITKQGAGKAVLALDATLAADTTVNVAAGELQIGDGGTAGTVGQAAVTNAGTLHFNLSRNRLFANNITGSGTGSIVKSGTGTVTLTGTLVNPGTTTVNGGRLLMIGNAKPTGTSTVINSGAELEARISAGNHTYTGTLSGAGKLIKTGGNEFFLDADNSGYTGEIEVQRGPGNSFNIRKVNALGSPVGKTVVHGLNGTGGQHLNIRNLGSNGPHTIAEPVELRSNAFGRAGMTHEGGSQTLNWTGPIGVYSTGRSAVNIRQYNAESTLNISGEISGTMGGAQLFLRGSSGPINVTGGINLTDEAELFLTENVRVRLGAAGKTYTNFRTTIANGHLRTLVDNALPPQYPLFLGEGNNAVESKFILGEGTTAVQQTISGIGSNNTNAGCRVVGGASAKSTLTIDMSGNSTFPSPFGGTGTENNLNLVKAGVGTLTLSTSSTHNGTTTVRGGTLLANGNYFSSAFNAQAGGTLGGTGALSSLSAGGTSGNTGNISPGNGNIGNLTVLGATTLGEHSAFNLQIGNWTSGAGTGYDLLTVNGALSLTATPANPITIRVTDIDLPLDNFSNTPTSFDFISAASITGFNSAAFVIDTTGFTTSAGSWSVSDAGTALRLTFTPAPVGGYTPWITSKGLADADALPGADPDNDGIKNAVEYVLGTEPNPANTGSMSVGSLPVQTYDANYLTVVYRRADSSATATAGIEYGSDLTGWTAAQDGVNGVMITTVNDGVETGIDEVTVKIPRTLEGDSKLFARLNVVIP